VLEELQRVKQKVLLNKEADRTIFTTQFEGDNGQFEG